MAKEFIIVTALTEEQRQAFIEAFEGCSETSTEMTTSATDAKATDTAEAEVQIPVPNEQTTEFELPAGEEETHHCSGHCGGSCNCKHHESTEKHSAVVAAGFPDCPKWLSIIASLTDKMLIADNADIIRGLVAQIRAEAWLMQWMDLVGIADSFACGDAVRSQIAEEVLDRIAKKKEYAMLQAVKEVAKKFGVTTAKIVEAIQNS